MREFAVPQGTSSGRSWMSQALHNKIIALVLAMIVAVPLLAAPMDQMFTGAAALMFELGAIGLLGMVLWRNRFELRRENVLTFLRTGANLPVLLLLALATLSCVLSPNQLFSGQELLKLSAGVLLYFVVAYQFRQSKHLSMLADALLFLSAAVSLAGMAQYQFYAESRAGGLFGNPQPLGSLVMVLLPVVLALAIFDKQPKRQIIAQITAVLMVGCLFLTHTRSAWMAAAGGLLALGFLALRLPSGREKSHLPFAARKHEIVLPLMLMLIAGGFFALMSTQNGGVIERAGTLTTLSQDVSLQGRIHNEWAGAIAMVKERPLTGWGLGLFPVQQHNFTNKVTEVADGSGRVSLTEQAHNFYLQTAAELGLPGLLLIATMLGAFLVTGLKRVDGMDPGIRHTLLMGSMASIVGFGIDAFSSPSWQYGQVSMFLWLMLGVGTSCSRPRVKSEPQQATVYTRTMPRRLARVAAMAVCVSLLAFLPTARIAGAADRYNPQKIEQLQEKLQDEQQAQNEKVQEAEQNLAEAQATGDPKKIEKAERQLQKAREKRARKLLKIQQRIEKAQGNGGDDD